MKSVLRYATHYWIPWLIVAALALGTVSYFMGYRLDSAGFSKVGTLVMRDLPQGSEFFIDGASRVDAASGTGTIALSPGSHTVIVNAPGYQPWTERFDVVSGQEVSPHPLLIRDREKTYRPLTGEDGAAALAAIQRAAPTPTKSNALTLEGGCALVYASGSRILAEATSTPSCTPPSYLSCSPVSDENPDGGCSTTIVRTDKDAIRALLPFPGRDDAVIVLSGNSVYALELDPRDPQTYVTLFEGPTIGMVSWGERGVAISNGTLVLTLSL